VNEAPYRELISGGRRGPAAALLRAGLAVLSFGYGAGVACRNALFDLKLRPMHRAPVPVISVGNITTGGTGKTPFVAWLAEWFHARNVRVALLSRGYRALPGQPNDEKLVLDQLCPGVPHLQNPDRVASAHKARREHGSQLLILDDGFQHRRLARDLDIVLLDALNPWGYGRLLPRGLLREPPTALRRASLVVLTRVDQCSPDARAAIIDRLRAIRGRDDHAEVAFVPNKLADARGASIPLSNLAGRKVAAFCGIGNPDGFRKTLDEAGIAVGPQCFRIFPDHHHYTEAELTDLERSAAAHGCEALVTTQKDLVKIDRTRLADRPLWGLRIAAQIVHGDDLLEVRLAELADLARG